MLAPDTRADIVDRDMTATEAIVATEIAAATVIAGCPGWGASLSAIHWITARIVEDRRASKAAALPFGS